MTEILPRIEARAIGPGPDISAHTGPRWISCRWLVSARYDLTWFIGSCVVVLVFLGLWQLVGGDARTQVDERVLLVYFFYTAIFDQPHIFQSFSRTHGDVGERSRRGREHNLALAGLICIGAGFAYLELDAELIIIAAIWGSYHIMRQHWGLLRAYQSLNADHHVVDRWLDLLVFHVGFIAFFLYDYSGHEPATVVYGELRTRFPVVPDIVGDVAWYAFWGLAWTYLAWQIYATWRGRPLNLPKLLLMTAALGTHGYVFCLTVTPFLIAEALETSYHNIQYQGWVMHYQNRRFGGRAAVLRWLRRAMIYGLVVGTVEIIALMHQALSWLYVPFAMIVLYHYYVDGRIWKLGSDAELRALMIEPRPFVSGLGSGHASGPSEPYREYQR